MRVDGRNEDSKVSVGGPPEADRTGDWKNPR